MLRARLVAAVAIVIGIAGLGLVGCASTSAPSWVPSWMTIKPPPPPTEALQFESEPAGADVHTADGQTCRTPCTLTLPVTNQSVNFAMNGYVPQTVPVDVRQGSDPPDLQPNPVQASLQAVPKPVESRSRRSPRLRRRPRPDRHHLPTAVDRGSRAGIGAGARQRLPAAAAAGGTLAVPAAAANAVTAQASAASAAVAANILDDQDFIRHNPLLI